MLEQSGNWIVTVKRDFVTQHNSIGGDWSAENEPLVDIVDKEHHLGSLVDSYRGQTLNDVALFAGYINIKRFCQIICLQLAKRIVVDTLATMTAKIWKNEIACVSFTLPVRATADQQFTNRQLRRLLCA